MQDADFKDLVYKLGSDDSKCALVLGPEFINIDLNSEQERPGHADETETVPKRKRRQGNTNAEDYKESLRDYLATNKMDKSIDTYLSEDGFFYYKNATEKKKVLQSVASFYQSLNVTESYKKISRIPFTTIISLSPDVLIKRAFEEIHKDKTFKTYKEKGFEDITEPPTKEKPLIYNLLGCFSERESLVFTFDDLFKFLDRLFEGSRRMEGGFSKFRQEIIETDSFLFLGFSYDKWYLKLVFYLLNTIRKQNQNNFDRHAIFNWNPKKHDQRIKFYTTSFQIDFSQESEREFISKLYQACEDYVDAEGNKKNILTMIKSQEEYDIGLMSAYINSNDLIAAIELGMQRFPPHRNDFATYMADFISANQDFENQRSSYEQRAIQIKKVSNCLKDKVKEIETLKS